MDQKSTHRVNQYTKWKDELKFQGIEFPVSLKAIDRFERLNGDINVNVFGYDGAKDEGVYPLRISRNTGLRHVDLMFLTNAETQHYCWVKSLSRLLTAQVTEHDGEAYFCCWCLNHFTRQDILDQHMEYCSQKKAVKIVMPEEGSYVSFNNHNRSMKVPFVV